MTTQEMEQLLLEGKTKKEIIQETMINENDYKHKINFIMAKYNNTESDHSRLHYINQVEKLFFIANEMYYESEGIEKLNWKIKRNELGRIYSTFNALTSKEIEYNFK